MKQFLLVLIAVGLFSCGGNEQAGQTSAPTTVAKPETKPEKSDKKVNPSDLLSADELATITGSNQRGGKQVKVSTTATLAADNVTLTNNGGGSFSIDYGGATNIVWMFFRGGDSTSSSGNVYPTATQSFYLNPVTSWTSNFTKTFYQCVVVFGTTTPDANGVVGADWVFKYSNVLN